MIFAERERRRTGRTSSERSVKRAETPPFSETIDEICYTYKQFFIGQSYLAPLTTEQIPTFNVTFEPSCRNNWHIHHSKTGGGQMLIVIFGEGWYQEWGRPARKLKVGDIVNIPPNVKHWHGAAKDSWFQHLAQEIPGTETSNEWLEPVSDEEYNKLGE